MKFYRFFIIVSLLKISYHSNNLLRKFAVVAMKIDNSSMAMFFSLFIANIQCELNLSTLQRLKNIGHDFRLVMPSISGIRNSTNGFLVLENPWFLCFRTKHRNIKIISKTF